jgi:hypothetical protein
MRTQCAVLACLVVLSSPATANAQDAAKTGIVMGYPASLGVIWQAGDSIAVRPEFTFTWTSAESFDPSGNNLTSWQFGVGASALFYFARHENLRPYFSPQWSYSHLSSGSSSTATGNANTFSGMVGAQYALGGRFAVFGETGAGYSRSSTTVEIGGGSISPSTRHTDNFGTRSRVGVILYF